MANQYVGRMKQTDGKRRTPAKINGFATYPDDNDMTTEVMIERIRKASGISELTKFRMEKAFGQRVSGIRLCGLSPCGRPYFTRLTTSFAQFN